MDAPEDSVFFFFSKTEETKLPLMSEGAVLSYRGFFFLVSSWISFQVRKWEQIAKTYLVFFLIVLFLAEMKLIFFIAAHMVQCFGFMTQTVLIIQGCLAISLLGEH